MSKTFTCKELGGICDKKISGDTFNDIIQKGMEHMMADEEHKKHMSTLSETTKETKEQWFERMNKEFDIRSVDNIDKNLLTFS